MEMTTSNNEEMGAFTRVHLSVRTKALLFLLLFLHHSDQNKSNQTSSSSSSSAPPPSLRLQKNRGLPLKMGIDNLGLRRGRGDDIRSSRGPGGIRGPPPVSKFRRGPGPRLPPDVCNNCRRPGHYARDCTNITLCNNCGLPGHATTSCTNERACWNCKETGHNASTCSNQGVCRLCSKPGHMAKDCETKDRIDTRLCKNCHRPGHLGAECKYEKACNNCRKPGHLARECRNTPVCNICNQKGHIARECGPPRPAIRSLAPQPYSMDFPHYSRNVDRLGHLTRECMVAAICETCGGRGHMAIDCPSDPLVFRSMGYRH